MDKLITIKTFTLPSELAVAKSRLESEGIQCFAQDELTVQSYNYLSNAIGGVKLQVRSSDYQQAYEILKHGGFIKEERYKPDYLEQKLSDPSFLMKIRTAGLIFLALAGIAIISVVIVYWQRLPSADQRLTNEKWCLDHIVLDDKTYYPNTLTDELRILLIGECNEKISFKADGTLELPGFDTKMIPGTWSMKDEEVITISTDTLNQIFGGTYKISMNKKTIWLTSSQIEIVCVKSKFM